MDGDVLQQVRRTLSDFQKHAENCRGCGESLSTPAMVDGDSDALISANGQNSTTSKAAGGKRSLQPRVLSSWKEIATYLDKGVRTVQRWERELGLPVRRPKQNHRGVVLAFPDEIDGWLAKQPVRIDDGEEMVLRQQLATLSSENAALRSELQELRERLESAAEPDADPAVQSRGGRRLRIVQPGC